MLVIAIIAFVAVLVWFYMTAQEYRQDGIKWAMIALIGYWLAWWLVKLTIVSGLKTAFASSVTMLVISMQVPTIAGVAVAYFVRKKLIADLLKSQ